MQSSVKTHTECAAGQCPAADAVPLRRTGRRRGDLRGAPERRGERGQTGRLLRQVQAIDDITLNVQSRTSRRSSGHRAAASRPSCAASTACTRSSPAPARKARCSSTGENIYARRVNPVDAAPARRHGVPEGRIRFPTMSIYDNVASGLELTGRVPKRHLDEVVERSLTQAALWDEVKDKLKQSAFDLSGGQQQRLCIARAIARAAGGRAHG